MNEDKVEYFIDQTNDRLKHIEEKLDLMIRRWSLFWGGAMAISAVVSLAVTIFFGR